MKLTPRRPALPCEWRRSVRSNRPGFTLLEMAVVLAIIMILALVVFSATLRQMDRVAAQKETAQLADFSTALQASIQRTGFIPGPANWVTNLAAASGASSNSILLNDRQVARLLLVDPRLRIDGAGLPYTQEVTGSSNRPTNARLMLLSRLGPRALPAALTAGTYTTADFTNLWNWAGGETTLPAGTLWNGWAGSGADLQVQRINLDALFVRLLLVNFPTNLPTPGRYTLGNVTNSVPNGPGLDAYFVRNSLIGLINDNGATDFQLLIRDTSIYYDRTTWRLSAVGYGDTITAARVTDLLSTMEAVMGSFRNSPRNANALGGATPDSVANAMTNFMTAYIAWANIGFAKTGSVYTTAKNYQSNVWAGMNNLIYNVQQGRCN